MIALHTVATPNGHKVWPTRPGNCGLMIRASATPCCSG